MSTGLKKVTDAQKTHKNPELRGSSVVTEEALNKNKKAAAPAKKAAAPAKQPPKLQLVGKKWSCVSSTFLMKIRSFWDSSDTIFSAALFLFVIMFV